MNEDHKSNISIVEAINILKEHALEVTTEYLPLTKCYNKILSEDLASKVDHPSCNNSALDGYACKEADTLDASQDNPIEMKLIGDVPAGSTFEGTVAKGEAVSIYTGAPVPHSADAIIAIEDTEKTESGTVLFKRPARSADIRYRAQDIKAGEVYIKAGTLLDPAAIGVAASMGYDKLPVAKAPRIGILATGDEVIEPGQPIRDGQVYNSNTYSVTGLIKEAGAIPVILPRAIDDPDVLRQTIREHGGIDLLITSGGVSMGNYDFVRDLLFNEGTVHFWKVAIRPGGPAIFGEWEGIKLFGLPGNPVSSMVVFMLVARAWVDVSMGRTDALPYHQRTHALAKTEFKGAGFKEAFRRAVLSYNTQTQNYEVVTTGNQSSGILTSMLFGNSLVIVPEYQNIEAGRWVEVIKL